jgi:hypothetical protein
MAVGIQLDFEGTTLEQYDQVLEKMGFAHRGAGAPGCVFHWVTKTDRGFRVTDVWESRESFEKFSEEKIGPLFRTVGVTAPPVIRFFEVHNYLTTG